MIDKKNESNAPPRASGLLSLYQMTGDQIFSDPLFETLDPREKEYLLLISGRADLSDKPEFLHYPEFEGYDEEILEFVSIDEHGKVVISAGDYSYHPFDTYTNKALGFERPSVEFLRTQKKRAKFILAVGIFIPITAFIYLFFIL